MNEAHQVFKGRLGRNPELLYTRQGTAVCKLSLALDESDHGRTIWKTVLIWGRLGESTKVMLQKGSHVFVEGIVKTREFINKEGQRKVIEELVANKVALSLLQ